MELIFLGTGAGVPAKQRNVSALALDLSNERGTTWLFDCGEATQHQILHTTIKPRKIEKIFITHLHGDHIFGLPGFLGSRSFQDGTDTLTVYGPNGIKEFIEVSLRVSCTHLKYPLEIVEINEGVIFEDEQFLVEAKKLEHGIVCYGYRIIEKDLKGSLQVEKLKALGIPPGPIYKKLKDGKTVTLDDGTILHGADFVGADKPGRKLAIVGDTRISKKAIELALDVDVLVHEATFGKEDQIIAHNYYHSTTEQAAYVAKEANVKKLILNHLSSRYQGEDLNQLLIEAQQIFPNVFIAFDFYRHEITRK
ncbi:ribonuclease Z [Calidifontibacillus erzurumensis]|uniref:Ribonuclease Z n=1 Tax=Calidifontibacillus erzurumensis TaxID=2741433 RepID=A0A8J8KA99_9BACI|nr:ribonuclease Z [Calidifontibacillus erzurumensis]NSL50422.1 ribonuclease Z [Calidifontibacillus erzurumensis]